jgi:putative chitinase
VTDRHVRAAMLRYNINTPLRRAHFLAQIDHESNGFRSTRENLNYTVEALLRSFPKRIAPDEARRHGRTATQPANQEAIANAIYGGDWGAKNLGNTEPGDGWKFIGRGLIQITGRANYAQCSREMLGSGQLLGAPQLLESAELAALSAGWFWKSRGLNEFADKDDLEEITRRINGGRNGLEHRKELLDKYKADLGVA